MLKILKKILGKSEKLSSKAAEKVSTGPILKSKAVCDEIGVKVMHPNGITEATKWDEIVKVSIITTDEGPFVDDVFLALFKSEKGCLVPSEADGYNDVYEKVSKFDGFNYSKVIEAMSSTTNNEFICWEKAKGE